MGIRVESLGRSHVKARHGNALLQSQSIYCKIEGGDKRLHWKLIDQAACHEQQ